MRNTSNLHRWGLMLGGLMVCIAAASLGPRKAAFATPSSGFTSSIVTASGVPEITLKTLSPTHQVRIQDGRAIGRPCHDERGGAWRHVRLAHASRSEHRGREVGNSDAL